jgi:hypothetical protein
MEDTYTISDGMDDHIFNKTGSILESGRPSTFWVKDSPQGDLIGETSLIRKSQLTRAGILGRNFNFKMPIYNLTTLKYEGRAEARFVLNAPEGTDTDHSEQLVNIVKGLLANATFVEAFIKGR